MQTNNIKQIQIKFETADIIPPPFSNQVILSLDFQANLIKTTLDLAYTYRDELTDEEILEEGFTGDEDLAWAGELAGVWKEPILSLLSKTPEKPNQKALDEEQNFLELSIDGKILGTPKNQEAWEYLLQELMQACLETYGKESPFRLIFKKIEQNKSFTQFDLILHYSTRTIEAYTEIYQEKQKRSLLWEEATDLIGHVFIGEFVPDKAQKNEPKNAGKFLWIGDGLWYECTKSLKNPNGNRGYMIELYQRFEEYL
jgi:hypothetical protein